MWESELEGLGHWPEGLDLFLSAMHLQKVFEPLF